MLSDANPRHLTDPAAVQKRIRFWSIQDIIFSRSGGFGSFILGQFKERDDTQQQTTNKQTDEHEKSEGSTP